MNITELNGRPLRLLIGGSPCTHWSIAQRKNRETKAEGEGWELFLNYVIEKDKWNPDIFLYENNESAADEIKNQISEEYMCEKNLYDKCKSCGNKWSSFECDVCEDFDMYKEID